MNIPWWGYVLLAGLSWGTYVPLIFFGGTELGGKANARLMAILCVGVAYFVLAVLFPLFLFMTGQQEWPSLKTTGLVFSALAGVAGAVGAICVVFASSAAVQAGKAIQETNPDFNPATFRMFIAPLIFGTAPVINTLMSSIWHPKSGDPFRFAFEMPRWELSVGIVLVGLGVGLVLYSKEAAEAAKSTPPPKDTTPAVANPVP